MATNWSYMQAPIPNPAYQAAYQKYCSAKAVYWSALADNSEGHLNEMEVYSAKCALDQAESEMNSIPVYLLG